MSDSSRVLGFAKGIIKYDGLYNSKKGWLSGALTVKRDPQDNTLKLVMTFDANPLATSPIFPLTSEILDKVTPYNQFRRLLIRLNDKNGTSIMIKDGDALIMKTFHDFLKDIQNGETNTKPEFVPYQSHSDTVLKTPNRTYDPPAAKSTPKAEHKYNKENASQGSERKFTSVKSRYDDNERRPDSQRRDGRTDKSRHFLDKAKEKSGEKLELESYKPKNFYNKDSDALVERSYGTFGMSSGLKRVPGLMSLSAGPKLKRPRLADGCASANNYVWQKSHSSSSFHTQAAGLQGFSNLGNTCYMNAILQALFNLETFSADIQNENLHRKMPNNENLFKSLAHLLRCKKAQVSIEKRRAALRQVKSAISTTAKRFSGYEQHDAHEFLNQVLDQLKEEIIKASKPPPQPDEDAKNIPVQELLLNPTSMNFEFEIIHTITCQMCHERVTKTEQFVDLSVDMPRKYKNCPYSLSLQDALDNFLRKEMIEYKCEECGHKKSEVTHKFAKLPRVLILHLKRYSFNTLAAANYKTARDIDIPKFIALGPHCEEETSPPQPPSIHMTPQKRQPSHKLMDFDTPDGTKRKLDLDAFGGRKFSFKKASTFADSDDDFVKKPPLSKSRADADAFRVIQESLKEKQKMEEAKRKEDRELRKAMELSKAESLKQEQKKPVEISNFTPGYISESQLEKMSEEEMIQYAMNQSSVETGAPLGDENEGFRMEDNSDVSGENDGPSSSCDSQQNNHVKFCQTESDSDHHLTGLKKTSGIETLAQFSEIREHMETYSEGAEEDFLVTDGRPVSLHDADSDKEDSNSDESSNCDAGAGGDKSQSGVNGAEFNAKNCVQNVTVKIKSGPDGDASFFDEDLDDSVLLENDEHSDQSHRENGKQKSTEKELVVISSAEDDDPIFSRSKTTVKSGDIFDSGTSKKRCKSGDPFSWTPSKSFSSKKQSREREHTPERLTLKRQGLSYSKSEQKLKQTSLPRLFGRRAFSAQKPMYDRSESYEYDTWDAVSSWKNKSAVPDSDNTGNSKKKGFDVTDGLASSRKKEPEDKHVPSESSSDDDQKSHWKSLNPSKKRSLSGGTERSWHGAIKSYIRYPHDEVDHSCPDESDLHDLTASQPKEGCSAPRLTAPSPEEMRKYMQQSEENDLATAIEKSRTDTGHATDFDEEEIQRAIEKSLLEGIHLLPPDIEKDENDNEVEVERSEDEYKILRENAEKGDLPYSYQLTSVVCHLGSSSSAGHYVSDVYDIRKEAWFSYDDSRVHNTNEEDVRASRKKSGYIFFYMNKDAVEELKDFYSKRNEKLTLSKQSSRHSIG